MCVFAQKNENLFVEQKWKINNDDWWMNHRLEVKRHRLPFCVQQTKSRRRSNRAYISPEMQGKIPSY